eukprot:tig00020539_g10425.t1
MDVARSALRLRAIVDANGPRLRSEHARFSAQPASQKGPSATPAGGPAKLVRFLIRLQDSGLFASLGASLITSSSGKHRGGIKASNYGRLLLRILRSDLKLRMNWWLPKKTVCRRRQLSRQVSRNVALVYVPSETQKLHDQSRGGRPPLPYANLFRIILKKLRALFRGEIYEKKYESSVLAHGEDELRFVLSAKPVRCGRLLLNVSFNGWTTADLVEAWKGFRAKRSSTRIPRRARVQIPGGQAPEFCLVVELLRVTVEDAKVCGLTGPFATSELGGRLEWAAQEAVRRCLLGADASPADVRAILINSAGLEQNLAQLTARSPPPLQRGIVSILACVCLAERLPSAAFPRCEDKEIDTSGWEGVQGTGRRSSCRWIAQRAGRIARLPSALPSPLPTFAFIEKLSMYQFY